MEWSVEQLEVLCPDSVVIDKKEKVICILGYTRPSDTKPEALSKYLVLFKLASLSNYKLRGWRVHLFPLSVGVSGSLLHTHWIPALEAMGIPEQHFKF